jgi:large conductance mechanosensitive channel
VLSLATAVGGGAFGKVVGSAVDDIIAVVGLLTGGVDFTTKFIALNGESYANLDAANG